MKLRGIVIAVIIVSIAVFAYHDAHKSTSRMVWDKPCTAEPCIKIIQSDGKEYKLNDFKFMPNHCIEFVSLPDSKSHYYCGSYKLDWIGPNTSLNMREF